MKLIIDSNLHIFNITSDLKKWCEKTLIVQNPDFVKKTRMNLWTGNTPKKIRMFEILKSGNEWVLPYGTLKKVLPFFDKSRDVIESNLKIPETVNYDTEIELYDYQKEAVSKMIDAQYGILQSPAGSGKTQMGIALACVMRKRCLWITHTKDLLKQSKQRAEKYINNKLIGTITEGKCNISEGITFATIQTLTKIDLTTLKDYWDMIIVDECHRCAGTISRVSQFSKVLNSLRARHKYGLSATVHRADGLIQTTYSLIGDIAYTVREEKVKDRIVPVEIIPRYTGIDVDRTCVNTDGTFNYSRYITHLVENTERIQFIIQDLIFNKNASGLVLSERLSLLETIYNMLPAELQHLTCRINGKMTSKSAKREREEALHCMRKGEKKLLLATYSLAKEGLDIPCLENLYLVTPQKDYAIITQSIGRVARVDKNKSIAKCYDYVDHDRYSNRAFKIRCRTYRKNRCIMKGEKDNVNG